MMTPNNQKMNISMIIPANHQHSSTLDLRSTPGNAKQEEITNNNHYSVSDNHTPVINHIMKLIFI